MDFSEGATRLDPDEKEGLKHPHVSTRGELDHLEQANIQEGLIWTGRTKRKDLLSEDFIRELHRRMFGDVWEWAGSFRVREKNIGIDPIRIQIELRKLTEDMRFWMELGTYSSREAVIRFHHRLVFIHLFPNGNGRHARIMADVILTKLCGLPSINWSGGKGSKDINQQRVMYIKALRVADSGNYQPLIKLLS